MSPEWLTAIGTLGTFAVIAASAIAALMQLRHMGRSNQIAAFDEIRQTMESAEFRKALNFVQHGLSERFSETNLAATVEEIPVLIVGGSLVGLTTAHGASNQMTVQGDAYARN